MINLLLYLGLLLLIILVFGSAAYAGFQAAPWVPVFKRDIERILRLAEIKDNELVYDLGSGDGRILAAIANNSKAQVVGYEISLIPYLWSKVKIFFLRLSWRVEIRYENFLNHDLSQADVIFCFLTPMAMKKLCPKFKQELKPGTRIISYSFSLPDWNYTVKDKPDGKAMTIFKYVVD